MIKIFISYRRADSRKDAGRIYDRLVQAFGKENIFKDVDDIQIGEDFRSKLREATAQCSVMLVIIGKQWLDIKNPDGTRRLDNEGDWVRLEVEAGLQRDGCLVVPVLVDNAAMPSADKLPTDLRELAFKHAAIVRDDPDFHRDVNRIINAIKNQPPIQQSLLDTSVTQDTDTEIELPLSTYSVADQPQPPKPKVDLEASAAQIRSIIGEPFEWCAILEGAFFYGHEWIQEYLTSYAIAKYPITHGQYKKFFDADEFRDLRWWEGIEMITPNHFDDTPDGGEKIPRNNVNMYDAIAFCRWLSWKLGGGYVADDIDSWLVRLPTEFEWEKAARGTDGRTYPYGNEFNHMKCNTKESKNNKLMSVEHYLDGASPHGVIDMCGNAKEWCFNDFYAPYHKLDRVDDNTAINYVLRGGSFRNGARDVDIPNRHRSRPIQRYDDHCFRIMRPL